MRKQNHDFKKLRNNDPCYDPDFDADLIEASFASQYGIRLRQEPDITYAEWARLLSGLMPETPLGRVVQIRVEKDPKVLKQYTEYERKIRSDWAKFKSVHIPKEQAKLDMAQLQQALKSLFSKEV